MHAHLPIKYPFYDVIVVGARCAGASTAMLLARAGLRVLVIDRQLYGSDTLSTHALMRPAVVQLARWGLLEKIVAESTPVITATSFHYGGDDVVTIPVQGNAGIPGLVAPRRTVLDRLLVDAAIEAGAEVVHGVVAQELLHHRTGRVGGVRVRCAELETGSQGANDVMANVQVCGDVLAFSVRFNVSLLPSLAVEDRDGSVRNGSSRRIGYRTDDGCFLRRASANGESQEHEKNCKVT